MPQSGVEQLITIAVQHHQAGRLAEAAKIYQQVLAQTARASARPAPAGRCGAAIRAARLGVGVDSPGHRHRTVVCGFPQQSRQRPERDRATRPGPRRVPGGAAPQTRRPRNLQQHGQCPGQEGANRFGHRSLSPGAADRRPILAHKQPRHCALAGQGKLEEAITCSSPGADAQSRLSRRLEQPWQRHAGDKPTRRGLCRVWPRPSPPARLRRRLQRPEPRL